MQISTIFKTFIIDANSLGVAIDRLGAVTKTNYALYGKALEGLSARQVALALSTKKLSAAELEEIVKVNHLIEKYGAEELIKVELLSANSALLASERAISIERARELLQKAGIEEKDAEMLISKHLSIVADGEEATAKQVLIKELLDEAVTKELVTSGNAKEILSSQGVILNDIKETASKKALTTALRKEASARLISISKYALLAASIYAVYKAHDYLVTTLNETEKKFNNQKSKLEEYQSELDSTSEKLSETKDKLNELNNLKINGEITTVQLEELSTLKQQTAEYQAQYDLILAKTEAQKIAAQASASELISLQKEYEKLQNSPWLKYSEKVFSVTQYNPYAAGGVTKGLEWLTSAFGKKENKVSKFFGGVNDWTSGRTLFEMATGIDTEGVKNYKTAEEYLEKYKKLQGELNDLYKKSESESLTVKESKRLLKLKEELGNVSPKLLDEYNNNLSVLELYKSDEHSKEIFEDAIKELEDKNKAIMYTLNSIDLENSSEDDIRDYVKYKLSESGITNEELIDSISKSADTYKVAAKMFKEGVSVEDIVSYLNPKDDLLKKLIPSNNGTTAGIASILKDSLAQVNPDIVTNWVKGLTDEEARLAKSAEFEKALEKRKSEINGAILSAEDYTEALQKVKDTQNQFDDTSISFTDIFNSSDFADAKEKLLDLAKSGELTPETIESTEDYKKLLDETGLSAEEAKNKILGLLNSQEKLAAASQGIDKLKSAYEEFKDESIGFVTAETLESLPDAFKTLDGFDLFSKIVGDPTQSTEKMQSAFNDLVTEYIRKQGTLTGLINASESEVNSYIANLKQMGITNAEEVVKNARNSLSENDTLLQAAESEYIDYLKNKDKYDENYITNVASKNGQLISTLGSGYQNDYDNWCNLLSRKSEAYNKFVSALGASASSAASKMYTYNDTSAYQNAKKILEDSKVNGVINNNNIGFANLNTYLSNSAKYTQQQVNEAKAYIEAYESAQAMSESLNFDLQTLNLDFGGSLNFDGTSKDKSNSSKSSDQTFDWIERKVNNLTKALNNLKDASDDTYSSWANRSTALTKAIDTTRQAIDLQKQAYNRYMQEAESVALPDIYKNLIKNGALDISVITDEDTKEKINDYQEWYDKAQDCLDVQKDLMDSLNELNSKKFDNIQSIFDFDKSKIEHSLTMLNSQIDKLEMKGLFANERYYNQMLQYTQKEINSLTNERKQLANVMNSSALSQDSEAWREMYSTLTQIDEEILELNNDIVEFNNSIRDLNWEIFEYLEESINRITDETEYLADLLSNEDLYDDNGNLTKYADATIGLYATAYDTYRQQAKDYYEEVQDLQKKLVNGAGKDVLEQYYKMVDAHQEAVKSANQEKQAILDLISDGYQKQIDYLNEIINKKKDSLNAEKD